MKLWTEDLIENLVWFGKKHKQKWLGFNTKEDMIEGLENTARIRLKRGNNLGYLELKNDIRKLKGKK